MTLLSPVGLRAKLF